MTETLIRQLGVEQLRRGRYQHRRTFEVTALEELAQSIDEMGVIEPLIVRASGGVGRYEILAGERRWRAAQRAGLHTVPCIVRDDLSDEQAAILCITENIQRENLSPIEEAEAYRRLHLEFSMLHKTIGAKVGRSRAMISNLIRLLDLNPDIVTMIHEGILAPSTARALLPLPERFQLSLADMALRYRWNTRKVEQQVKDVLAKLDSGPEENLTVGRHPDIVHLERVLSEHTKAPVSIEYDELVAKGQFRIEFHSLEEAQGILEALGFDQWGVDK